MVKTLQCRQHCSDVFDDDKKVYEFREVTTAEGKIMTHLKGLGCLIATCLQALLHSWVTEQYIYVYIMHSISSQTKMVCKAQSSSD